MQVLPQFTYHTLSSAVRGWDVPNFIWDVDVAGSNPVTPTTSRNRLVAFIGAPA